ncbi:hypothetical protein [uncultured Winogradskyella sp.]|uniref:hypothetical protein n=1 Tax=uncultured Winogradskyella sp. TaxID=395353 RepID=UPI002605960C|nr:hypothetical protein [uncultured Winogradskyella sp.]
MKKSVFIVAFFVTLIFTACTSDEMIVEQESFNGTLTEFIYSIYDTSTLDISEQTIYILGNNRILSSLYNSNEFNTTLNSTYSYLDDRITEIVTYENNQMIKKTNYNYDNNGNLLEYISMFTETDTLQLYYDKHTFTHTQDTIFAERKRSTDGINYDTFISTMKMILEDNDNRTYFEIFDYINNGPISVKRSIYDTNDNMITEETSVRYTDGTTSMVNLNTYGYNTSVNTLQTIYEETFGRKNTMLLYHLESQIIFNFNPRFLSPNSMSAFSSTSVTEGSFPVEFENTLDTNNISLYDDYRVYTNNSIDYFYKFTLEYVFE